MLSKYVAVGVASERVNVARELSAARLVAYVALVKIAEATGDTPDISDALKLGEKDGGKL